MPLILFSNKLRPNIYGDSYNSIPVGKQLPGAAQNIASFWTTYIIPKGNLKGFGGGLGLYYVGDRFVDSANTLKLPSYLPH
ncbi:TonB-dependent receptor domain-containing protein [Nostoc sp.]|uniref:TonB-dependent receptor domain-containing protein n=1 Tax=Nostoc sp. TaxID=1180 RepID=UPI002FF83FD4